MHRTDVISAIRCILRPSCVCVASMVSMACVACNAAPPIDPPAPEGCQAPGPAPARRLNRVEYLNTINDVLGVDLSDSPLPPDVRADGFSNTADALIVTFAHAEAYSQLAETAAERVEDWSALSSRFGGCTPGQAGCFSQVTEALGAALYRRALTEEERATFQLIEEATTSEPPSVSLSLVLRAMLQSPPFLYRLEQSGAPDVSALATRLAYLVWGSAPDAALRSADLSTPTVLKTQITRMLEDPRARRAGARYVVDWLNLDVLDTLNRDPVRYPNFDRALAEEMKQETITLFDALAWTEPMSALFLAEAPFASPRLAELYGSADPALLPHRRGLLTHAGVLTVSGEADEASLVKRGLYMLENILCGTVEAPPANLNTDPPETAPGQTQRTHALARLSNSACAGCHAQMDPLAFGFDPFDGIGAFNTEDAHGNALLTDGTFVDGVVEGNYSSMDEYMALLAQSPRVLRCLVEKQVQYAFGRPLTEADRCAVDRIEMGFMEGGASYPALLKAIATDARFSAEAAE